VRLKTSFICNVTINRVILNEEISFYSIHGIWKLDLFHYILPNNMCDEGKNDFPNWTPTAEGQFNLKSTYKILIPHTDMLAWKWSGPTIRSFLWKLVHGRLLTIDDKL
jgi:hypothetical protein